MEPRLKARWNQRMAIIAYVLALLGCFSVPLASAAAEPAVGVVYPDIREPFRGVFLSIAKGIGSGIGSEPQLYALPDTQDVSAVEEWVTSSGIQVVIALGSRGPSISEALSGVVPVVIGAVHISPELIGRQYSGIALNPDPNLMLQRLKFFAPGVQRVTLVYHREREAWLVEKAADAARKLGLELNPIPVDRLHEAVNTYGEVLSNQRSGTDALWLSQDSAVLDEHAVLPLILREAWNRKLIVFSTNPAHVRRGILFALYPDNFNMGHSLGRMALELAKRSANPKNQGVQVLRDVSIAVNVRTANHFGLRYTKEVLRDIDLVFPLM
jgi:putative ABC transport system substrate-binding protein